MFFLSLLAGYWVATAALALLLQPDDLSAADTLKAAGIALALGPLALALVFAAILREGGR